MMMRFLRDERGATAIEYALIASLIAMAIIGSVILLGDSTSALYSDMATKLGDAMG